MSGPCFCECPLNQSLLYYCQAMERENWIMFARKNGLERKKRAYVYRKHALLGTVVPSNDAVEEEEEEDPQVLFEVEMAEEEESQSCYWVYEDENEEGG